MLPFRQGGNQRERENHEEVPGTLVRVHAVRVLLSASGLWGRRVQLGCICKRIGLVSFCKCIVCCS